MKTSCPLIEALCNPALYPHPVTGFQTIETHLSWIILTGPYAYKIKKPLNLGFQDFTTLDKRQHYCELELLYNQPLAGEIYEAVIPITGTDEQPAFNGQSPMIEYAIQMIQFDPQEGFNLLADHQQLTPNLIHMLAKQIAHFHGNQPFDIKNDFGIPTHVLAPMKANVSALETLINDPTQKERIQHLAQWLLKEYDTHYKALLARKSSGFIRACHGDLHLGNVVLYKEKPLIFDCIEFNEEFRWIDVVNDIAFLSMDLAFHHLHQLKAQLLNTYFEQTFDYEGATLLPFYQCYRAMVRAKIAVLLAQQLEKDSLAYHEAMAEFEHYLELADSYTITPPATLTITVGPSGSGKSVYTEQLLTKTEAIRLRSDVFRKRHFNVDPSQPSPEAERGKIYSEEATKAIYVQLVETAEMLLNANQSVIIDAACLQQWQRQGFLELAKRLQVPFKILVFDVPKDILIERLHQRQQEGEHISDATVDVINEQLAHQEPLTDEEQIVAQWIKN